MRALELANQPGSAMSQDKWDRFKTGQALKGRLLQELVEHNGAGAILPAGALVGPWRIIELLGSGGMAHVYLAERADGQFDQQVALKLVRRNVKLIDRLRHERQIVAGLRHPHIVSLVDGGETADGDLWFAMAVVDGVSLDRYAQEQHLDWRARLELFDAVCAAVEYAHGRTLIHRDIKPANILVDAHGHPRLLDFGIALEDGGDGSDDHVLTPGFASPEQVAGLGITTTSDIYQLGLVLRRLLGDAKPAVALHATSTLEWKAPTDTVPADSNQAYLADTVSWISMPRAVRLDLARLVARATAADQKDRYATAAALREDLAAVLARRPLAQDRDSGRVRLARLIERNRLTVVVVAIALLTLASSLTLAAVRLRDERNQAVANEQRANAVSEFLVSTLTQANPYAPQKGSVTVLEAMDHAAATLDEGSGTAPELRRQLRTTIGNVYMNLDESKRCLELLSAAQADQDLHSAAPIEQARAMILRSECHLALDERDESWRWLESAQAVLKEEGSITGDQLRAFVMVDKGQLLSLNGKLIEANALFQDALALAIRSGSVEQEYRASRMLGNNVQAAGDNPRAIELLKRAQQLATQTLGPTHRSTLTTAGSLAVAQGALKQWAEAEQTLRSALDAAESIRHRGATPDIVIAQLRDNYAQLLWQQGRFDECLVEAKLALAIYKRMASATSSQGFNPSYRAATCAYQHGQLDTAFDLATQALGYAKNGVAVGMIISQRLLAAISARRGELELSAQYLAGAEAALAQTEVASLTVRPSLQLTHALLAIRSGDVTTARAHLQRADDLIGSGGQNPAWLQQERTEIAAMIAAGADASAQP